jgi:paraquat-inducible protein B
MSAQANHWKLGAFVLGSVMLGAVAAVLLAAQTMQVITASNVSYFDEAVTGLEVGSPISFRGVKIGNVSAIDVAPDRRHVEVTYQLGVRVLHRLGLAGTSNGKETKLSVPPDLRVQLASTGLTGTKYLQIDFFPSATPPPVLPFPVPDNYIPATPSTMKNLEDAVVRAVDMIPLLTEELGSMATRLNSILDDVHRRGIPARAAAAISDTDQLVLKLSTKLDQLQVPELSHDAQATLTTATSALARMNRVLDHIDGKDGLLVSAQRTSDALGDLAGPRLDRNLEETGRDLRDAATAVRQLAEALQLDPDMLLKGKAKVHP